MTEKKKAVWKWLVILCVMIFLIGELFFLRNRGIVHRAKHNSKVTEEERVMQERTARVANWLSKQAVPILSDQIEKEIEALCNREACTRLPPGGTLFAANKLTMDQKKDLKIAIKELMQAYAKNEADAVFDYMDRRDEKLEKDWGKSDLIKHHGFSKKGIGLASEKQVFNIYWNKVPPIGNPHWFALIRDSGCILLWTSNKPLSDKMKNALGQDENEVFMNYVRNSHAFVPKYQSFDKTLSENGMVLLADVKVIIQYDKERLNEPRPHYVRYWLDPSRNHWHPLDLVLIPTVDGTYPSLWF